jgi:hypothetical protein
MTFEFNPNYFFRLAQWIINSNPGSYKIKELSNDYDKFFNHINWYSMTRPAGFNKVEIVNDEILIKPDGHEG